MEQAELMHDLIYLSGAETPSFSALAARRFSDRLAERAVRHLRAERILPEHLFLKKRQAPNADLHRLYYDVLFLCVFTENGKRKRGTFVLRCVCDLDDAFKSTRILSVSRLSGPYDPTPELTDSLVPVLEREDLDRTAGAILSEHFPEALEGAPVDAMKLAERIGLIVEQARPGDDPDMFGQVYFESTSDAVPDPETGILKIRSVERGTVLIHPVSNDPDTDRKIRNNTILHECVHWILHRPAFLLYGIWHPEFRSHVLKDDRPDLSEKNLTLFRKLERQADALSPRILMPADPVRSRIRRLAERHPSLPADRQTEAVIRDLSAFYGASRRLTEIRLTELGYDNPIRSSSRGSARRYEIGAADAVREFRRNPAFQKALSSGRFRYADRRFVLRDEKFSVLSEDGNARLTEYAEKHPERCCLSFTDRKTYLPSPLGMRRYAAVEQMFLPSPLPDMKALADSVRTVSNILRSLPSGFSDTLVAHMKRKHITSEALSEASCISVRQIARLRNSQFREIPLPTAVALCVGLKLHPCLCSDLISKAGIRLNDSVEHTAFRVLLDSMTENSIYECDVFLSELGIPPLERKER